MLYRFLFILLIFPLVAFCLDELPGWPVATVPSTGVYFSSPLAVNLDTDDELEIITAGPDNFLRIYEPDGSLMPGYPLALSGNVLTHVAFGNVTSALEEMVLITEAGDLYVIDRSAAFVPPFDPFSLGDSTGPAGPVLWDFDDDGQMEIVVHTGNNIHLLDGDGTELGTFPRAVESEFGPAGSPAIGDMDCDGSVEIIAIGYQNIYAFEATGNVLFGFPIELDTSDAFSYSSPILLDSDLNDTLEIACGFHEITGSSRGKIGLWDINGDMIGSWPISTGGYGSWVYGSCAAGDLDGDGKPEIAVTSLNERGYLINDDATFPDPWSLELGIGELESSPVLYDFDSDAGPDILFLGNDIDGGITCMNAPAADIDSFPFDADTAWGFATPWVGDLNNDGDLDICAVDRAGSIHIYTYYGDGLPYGKPWPVGRHDPMRTGWLHPITPDTLTISEQGDSILLKWTSITVSNLTHYNVYGTTDENDTSGATEIIETDDTSAVFYPDSALTYYFVTASTKYNESQRSIIIGLDTTNINDYECTPTDYSIVAYPNPFNSYCNITAPSASRIMIYDIEGRRIAEIPVENGNAVWNPDMRFPSGIYMIKSDNGQIRKSTRIVLLR